jgi:hypothetical protein
MRIPYGSEAIRIQIFLSIAIMGKKQLIIQQQAFLVNYHGGFIYRRRL